MVDWKKTSEEIDSIAREAKELFEVLTAKAADDKNLTAAEKKTIETLLGRSERAVSEASQLAKQRRTEEIAQLQGLIKTLGDSVNTPGMDPGARDDMRAEMNRKKAQLARLSNRQAMDFAGILSASEVREIGDLLKRAKKAVASKKKAAAHLVNLLKVADMGMSIATKFAGL